MNTLLAAPAARRSPVDILFSQQSIPVQAVSARAVSVQSVSVQAAPASGIRNGDPERAGQSGGDWFFANARDSILLMRASMQRTGLDFFQMKLGNPAMFREAFWRNPVRMNIRHWGRREMMHIFNGLWHQNIDNFETYETFGRCYTCPDPFRNDDPPWAPCFCA